MTLALEQAARELFNEELSQRRQAHRVGDRFVVYYPAVNGADVLSIGAAWADQPEAFSVQGPANTHQLTYQEIEEGKLLISVTGIALE